MKPTTNLFTTSVSMQVIASVPNDNHPLLCAYSELHQSGVIVEKENKLLKIHLEQTGTPKFARVNIFQANQEIGVFGGSFANLSTNITKFDPQMTLEIVVDFDPLPIRGETGICLLS